MTIIEALKISDKVRREGRQPVSYWIHFNSCSHWGFTKEDLLATDWQPYEPEKVKCEACQEADVFNKTGLFMMERHLRQFHCQCGR